MRKRLTYANVTATLALVFAMTGGALATKHYLINSTKQISPKALRSIRNDGSADTTLFNKLAATATVAKANTANTANTATSATTAGSATNATKAASATTAETAAAASSLTGLVIVHSSAEEEENPPETQSAGVAVCPAGMHVIAGGVVDSGGLEESVNEEFITSEGKGEVNNAYEGLVNNTSPTKKDEFNVWAVCAHVSITGSSF